MSCQQTHLTDILKTTVPSAECRSKTSLHWTFGSSDTYFGPFHKGVLTAAPLCSLGTTRRAERDAFLGCGFLKQSICGGCLAACSEERKTEKNTGRHGNKFIFQQPTLSFWTVLLKQKGVLIHPPYKCPKWIYILCTLKNAA